MLKFHIRTYGCQMNERDSEAVASALLSHGYQEASSEEDADILLFNTCSVRELAERKALGKIGILKKLKRQRPDVIIGVLGCMAQRMKDEILEEQPHVDFVAGTEQFHKIPEMISTQLSKRKHLVAVQTDSSVLENLGGHIYSENQVSAYISVMRGCGCFCSYCIVPFVRGGERSRSADAIVDEAKELASNRIREIVLLGQNIAAYGLDGREPSENSPFAALLERLDGIEGLLRIRFTSPHLRYFNRRLIDAVASLPKVCRNVHLPMQSGADRILKLMNRRYTARQYMEIVGRLREKAPGITFSTDVIVGFPSETEEDFNATRALMEEAAFDNAYIFKYSPRDGTSAAKMPDDVPQAVKEERNQILLSDLAARTEKHNSALVGTEAEILVEGESKRNKSRWCGRTGTNKVVVFDPSPEIRIGSLVKMEIVRATSMTLFGKYSPEVR